MKTLWLIVVLVVVSGITGCRTPEEQSIITPTVVPITTEKLYTEKEVYELMYGKESVYELALKQQMLIHKMFVEKYGE